MYVQYITLMLPSPCRSHMHTFPPHGLAHGLDMYKIFLFDLFFLLILLLLLFICCLFVINSFNECFICYEFSYSSRGEAHIIYDTLLHMHSCFYTFIFPLTVISWGFKKQMRKIEEDRVFDSKAIEAFIKVVHVHESTVGSSPNSQSHSNNNIRKKCTNKMRIVFGYLHTKTRSSTEKYSEKERKRVKTIYINSCLFSSLKLNLFFTHRLFNRTYYDISLTKIITHIFVYFTHLHTQTCSHIA